MPIRRSSQIALSVFLQLLGRDLVDVVCRDFAVRTSLGLFGRWSAVWAGGSGSCSRHFVDIM